jgi:hypothetical protein
MKQKGNTQCGPKVLGLIFFKNRRHIREMHTFFFFINQNKLHWHICSFCVVVQFPKSSQKFLFFGPSLIHQLRPLGSQQHPQSEVLLNSFSTWGTENSLADINLDSRGAINGCNIFWGQKFANTCSFVGGRIIVQQEKISRAERSWMSQLNALQEVIHYSFIKFCIYCFSICYEFFVHYALRVEKNYQHGLDSGPLEFQFLRPRDV